MRSKTSDWKVELARWLKPFLARRRMCPLYVTGLIAPADRSVQPMAERLAPGNYDQLHIRAQYAHHAKLDFSAS
jgi:hypothetical protein